MRMLARGALAAINGAMLTFMLSPLVLIVLMSFSPSGAFRLPGWNWSLRWYEAAFSYPGFLDAFLLSLRIASSAAALATVLAFTAVFALHRFRPPAEKAMDSFFMAPLLVPAVVFGIAMLQFLNRQGLYNTFIGMVLAHAIVVVPFIVRSADAALRNVPEQLEWAAMSLGSNLPSAVLRVTLPLCCKGLLAGFVFAFIVSFDEVTVTIFIAGPAYQTLPIRLYNYLTDQVDPTVAAISSMLILLSLCLIVLLERLGAFQTLRH